METHYAPSSLMYVSLLLYLFIKFNFSLLHRSNYTSNNVLKLLAWLTLKFVEEAKKVALSPGDHNYMPFSLMYVSLLLLVLTVQLFQRSNYNHKE